MIIKLQGGLGNQMFQYAYIKALSLRTNSNLLLDLHEYKTYFRSFDLECFAIQKRYCKHSDLPWYENLHSNNKYINFLIIKIKGLAKKLNKNHYVEKQLNFDTDFLNIKQGHIEGYFQTEQYFIDYEDEIRNDFTFAIPPSSKNQETIDLIDNCNAVSIHIRRGDYVSNTSTNSYHGVCSLDYYHKAIKIITEKVNNPVFFFFSDDMDRVKENLKVNQESHYVDRNDAETNYEDMRLMNNSNLFSNLRRFNYFSLCRS